MHEKLKRVVFWVAALNMVYFGIEFVVASRIGSVSLFADSVDFLEDTAINALILIALSWSARNRARLGMVLAAIILVPGFSALWAAWQKISMPVPPEPIALSLTGSGAFFVNLFCALILARFRKHSESLVKAAFLSARNDVLANIAIVGAGLITAYTYSVWPDLIVGFGIIIMNADAAKEIFLAAKQEHHQPEP